MSMGEGAKDHLRSYFSHRALIWSVNRASSLLLKPRLFALMARRHLPAASKRVHEPVTSWAAPKNVSFVAVPPCVFL